MTFSAAGFSISYGATTYPYCLLQT